MAGGAAYIKTIGVKKTRRMFDKLPLIMRKKVARKMCRNEAKRMQKSVAFATPVGTGVLANRIRMSKIRSRSRSRRLIRIGWVMPTRQELGLPAYVPGRKVGYYPYSLEYGYALVRNKKIVKMIPPKRFIRNTVARVRGAHVRVMAQDLRGIIIEAKKLGNHKKVA